MTTTIEKEVVEKMFRAMQLGREGEELMMSLFDDDATFIESLSGEPETHQGKPAIRKAFQAIHAEDGPPDLALRLDRMDKEGETVRADWSCTSAAFPTPIKGHDLLDIRDGLIRRLEIVVTEMPDFGACGS